MKMLRKSTALALATVWTVLLVAGVVSASAQSGAQHAANVGAIPRATRAESLGFLVVNLSSHTIELLGVTGDNRFEGRPPDGATLRPKSQFVDRFNVQTTLFRIDRNTAHYAILGADRERIGYLEVDMNVKFDLLGPFREPSACRTSLGTCTVSPGQDVITLFDPSGPTQASPRSSAKTSTSGAVARVLATRGFLVYDLSQFPLRLLNVTGDNNFETRPADGSILEAMSAWHRFEVELTPLPRPQRNSAHYAIVNTSGKFNVHMEAGVLSVEARCDTVTVGTCLVSPAHDVIFYRTIRNVSTRRQSDR